MPKILLNKTTYGTDDEIRIQIDFSDSPSALEQASNINIDIFRIDVERNNFAFGFGAQPPAQDNHIELTAKLPENFREGLYIVSGVRLIYGEDGLNIKQVEISNPINSFFWFSNNEILDGSDLHKKIDELDVARKNCVNAEMRTSAATGEAQCAQFKVVIFGVGCLLHAPQLMEGYVLHPLGGYSYDHMLEAVNTFMSKSYRLTLDKVDSIKSSFASSTPVFAVEFNNIQAVDHRDAGWHCEKFSENIFTILAYDRGQRPRTFATVIIDIKSGQIWQAFHFPGYKGNLISDFNPSSTANTLQRLLPKIENSPWVDLILRIYADAKTESNLDYSFLKFWQILEMLAKRQVTNDSIELLRPDGTTILDAHGNAITTKYALGKVYKFLFDREGGSGVHVMANGKKLIFETSEDARTNPNFDTSTTVVSLWEILGALYQIRNSTAHSGKFDIEAAKHGTEREQKAVELLELEHGAFISQIRSLLMMTVISEVNNA